MAIIECVPNFSEGKDLKIVDAIANAIQQTGGVALLHQDGNAAANRTVFTFAGDPDAVFKAAYAAIEVAVQKIDMRQQKGEHPRIGACDVCPFVPISGITQDELNKKVKAFGQVISADFKMPVFFYEDSAVSADRINLAHHRKGDYEQLENRMRTNEWPADHGPYNAQTGGTVMGVRPFLVAYNINLNSKDANIAKEIAYDLRASGRPKKAAKSLLPNPMRLEKVKAIGWYIKDFDRAQVSINLTDYRTTSLYKVFKSTVEIASNYGIEVTGSELIGLIPLPCILACGKDFNPNVNATEMELIQSAIQGLGLDELHPFDPNKRILEYVLNERLYAKGKKK